MRSWGEIFRAAALVAALVGPAAAAPADELAVDVVNASTPTLCAETDNVYLKLISGETARFAIEAVHPAYVGTIVVDRSAPDFRNCDMAGDPACVPALLHCGLRELSVNAPALADHFRGVGFRPRRARQHQPFLTAARDSHPPRCARAPSPAVQCGRGAARCKAYSLKPLPQ